MLKGRDLETLYTHAYHFYERSDYAKASKLFTQLVMHDPFQGRFWKGLAASNQMQKEYKAALYAWGVLALLEGHDPMAHFHAAECYLSDGEIEEAKKALTCATLHLRKDHPLSAQIHSLAKELTHG